MNTTRSSSLDLTRILGMFFVMFIHSSFIEDGNRSMVHYCLKSFIASGAVPVFFLLAGYLSAKNMDSPTLGFSGFIEKKAKTLIIPFLFWNSLALILVFIAKLTGISSAFQGNGAYFDVAGTPFSILSALLGLGRQPIVYQFWFLRDLIVVSIISFLFRRAVPKIPFLPWMLFLVPIPMASSMAFYLLGYSMKKITAAELPKQNSCVLYCLLWIILGVEQFFAHVTIPSPIQQLGSAAFIFMLAHILSYHSWGTKLSTVGASVFFIYAAHEPLQTIMAKSWQILGVPGYGSLGCFLLIPATSFLICLVGYKGLKKITPKLMPVITGGR